MDTAGGLADTLQTGDDRLAAIIFDFDSESALGAFSGNSKITDVTFFFENGSNSSLLIGRGHDNFFQPGASGIADAGEHIGDGILHTHFMLSS